MFKYVAVCMIMAMAERSLPLPDRDVPNSVSMSNGRVDYHGWLFLPFEHQEQAPKSLSGWLYHHTPEFFVHSPHDFEIMVEGRIDFDETAQKVISHFPIPPSVCIFPAYTVLTLPRIVSWTRICLYTSRVFS